MTLKITSPAFTHNGTMPAQYTCEGDNVSPPLEWSAPPEGTQSLVLIVDDPDAPDPEAPKMTWVHWLLYNLPPTAGSLKEHVDAPELPPGTLVGINDRKNVGYNGPCPPIGTHRYYHKLYALDVMLPDLKAPTKDELLKHMEGHILGYAELIGLYRLVNPK